MRMFIAAALLLALTLPAAAQNEHGHSHGHEHGHGHDHSAHWAPDFDKAVAKAKKEKKDLLVDFTGSDWCGWCIRLNKEVFDHHAFLDEAEKHFVLVALDFPRGEEAKKKVPNPDRNKELSEKYAVRGFPTILLMTADGEVYGRTGYRAGGPAKYVEHLNEFRTKGKEKLAKVKQLTADYEKAEDKAALVSKAVEMLGSMESDDVGVAGIAKIAKAALGGSDSALATKAIKGLLKTEQHDDAVLASAKKLDPKNEHGVYELVVKAQAGNIRSRDDLEPAVKRIDALVAMGPIKDKEIAKEFYANAAFWNHQFLKKPEAAKKYAKLLEGVMTEEDAPKFKRLLDMINK